jgi:hypothetical protein
MHKFLTTQPNPLQNLSISNYPKGKQVIPYIQKTNCFN